jgi:hypothetical protein
MAQSNNNSSCYCGSTCNNRSTAEIEDSRDVLKAMILQEERNYKCPNYLYHNNDNTTWSNKNETATNNKHNNNGNGNKSTTSFIQPQSPSPSSSWEIIDEIANLVTDVRSIVHNNNDDCCSCSSSSSSNSNNNNNNNSKDGEDKNQRKCKKCISPLSSTYDLYEDKTTTTTKTSALSSHSIRTDDTQQQEQEQKQQQSPHDYYCFSSSRQQNHCHRHRQLSCHETLCLSSWRHQMFDWACAVRDNEKFFEVNNVVLEVAFNILDRYVAVELYNSNDDNNDALPITREDFQLFAMVSIYIASKLSTNRSTHYNHHRSNNSINNQGNNMLLLDVPIMIDMAQGYYTEHDITTTERDILSALNWHVNPPTVIHYCDIYLNLFPLHHNYYSLRHRHRHRDHHRDYHCDHHYYQEETKKKKERVQRKCKYIATEIVLDDDFFLDKPHSVIALAVVLLATDASRSGNGNGTDGFGNGGDGIGDGNDGIGNNDIALQTFLRNIQGVVNVHELEFDSIIRRLECSC